MLFVNLLCNKQQANKYLYDKLNKCQSFIDISKEMSKIDGWNNKKDLTTFNFIDLFTGAGGLSCGLTMTGFNPIGSVEIMDCAVKTYKRNFTNKGFNDFVETRDVRKQDVKQELYNKVKDKHIHLIAGGFPCQGFSMAGKRIEDERNCTL